MAAARGLGRTLQGPRCLPRAPGARRVEQEASHREGRRVGSAPTFPVESLRSSVRVAWRPVASVTLAIVVLASYGGWRWYAQNRWKGARGHVDGAACPETKTLGGDCGACVLAECCLEVHACYSNADCIDLNDCLFKCADGEGPPGPRDECPAACEKRHAASIVPYHRWDDCARRHCEEPCRRHSDEEERDRAR